MAPRCIDRKALFQGRTQARETWHGPRGLRIPRNHCWEFTGALSTKLYILLGIQTCNLVSAPGAWSWKEYSTAGWKVSVKLLLQILKPQPRKKIPEKFQWAQIFHCKRTPNTVGSFSTMRLSFCFSGQIFIALFSCNPEEVPLGVRGHCEWELL